jgi:hypothetical protein
MKSGVAKVFDIGFPSWALPQLFALGEAAGVSEQPSTVSSPSTIGDLLVDGGHRRLKARIPALLLDSYGINVFPAESINHFAVYGLVVC